MDVDMASRVSERTRRSVSNRLEGGSFKTVRSYWLAGRCKSNPCRFLHTHSNPPRITQGGWVNTWQRSPNDYAASNGGVEPKSGSSSENNNIRTKPCKYWISGNCVYGEKCKYLHSWSRGNGLSMLAKLEGHTKAVTGIALPSGLDKLYSGGKDKTVRVWDCNSGKCTDVINLLGEVGCFISEGPWLFLGLENEVKVSNVQTDADYTLSGPVGQVYALGVSGDTLFAGIQNGIILAWKFTPETNSFKPLASLKGHNQGVLSLIIEAGRLYSSSIDSTIRAWDLNSFQCIETLYGHSEAVMSLLYWNSCLLSASLDGTIKVWAATEAGKTKVIHTHKGEHGFLKICGCHDAEAKPILLCSSNDNSVSLYDLPSFNERGRIFSKREVRSIQVCPGGLFFTGDASGQLTVWKLEGGSTPAV